MDRHFAEQWGTETQRVDFFDVKADVEALLSLTRRLERHFVLRRRDIRHFIPVSPRKSGAVIAALDGLGALHPEHAARMDLTYPVFLFEIETAAALAVELPEYREISKYPAIRRDIAVIVDEGVGCRGLAEPPCGRARGTC